MAVSCEHIERLNQLVATPNHLNPMTKIIAGASYRGRNSEYGDTLAFWSKGNIKNAMMTMIKMIKTIKCENQSLLFIFLM